LECIRRDQCYATQIIQKNALQILFRMKDISVVRKYLEKQWTKLYNGHFGLKLSDFIFSKSVKMSKYIARSSNDKLPLAAIVAHREKIKNGSKNNPPYGWRVPYVVVRNTKGQQTVSQSVVDPMEVLRRPLNSPHRIHHDYYITKQINPALYRLFRLVGIDVELWYRAMRLPAHRVRQYQYKVPLNVIPGWPHIVINNNKYNVNTNTRSSSSSSSGLYGKQMVMDHFVHSKECNVCRSSTANRALCDSCLAQSSSALFTLTQRITQVSQSDCELSQICKLCSGVTQTSTLGYSGTAVGPDCCSNISCPVLLDRVRDVLRLEDLMVSSQEVVLEIERDTQLKADNYRPPSVMNMDEI
jgi:DNA polymerase zeta